MERISDEQIYEAAEPHADDKFWVCDFDRAIANAQLAADLVEHERVVREIFSEIERQPAFHEIKLSVYAPIKGAGWYNMLKSKYLKEAQHG